jgi:SHS2 domain-containing protein
MYRFVDHTAELEIELEAESAEGVLEQALSAFAELVGPAAGGEPVERRVVVDAADLPALLASWLDELVFLAETEGLVPERADLVLSGLELSAVVSGRRGAPRHLVKALTLHRLRLKHENGVWRGRVVLDV